jgi:hypothetical protein
MPVAFSLPAALPSPEPDVLFFVHFQTKIFIERRKFDVSVVHSGN